MPFVTKIIAILTDIQGWILLLIGAITTVRVAKEGISYQQGGAREKADSLANIKSSLYMGGGIFVLVWLAGYVITKMK
jgi:hypothetical protein